MKPGEHATPERQIEEYTPCTDDPDKIAVYVLMGAEDEGDWDIHPERDAIIIGTQDMLLSRALNRGYAASRARWPMQFGLLHTDCLWVFDEIQLMGSGLATTAQLEAFRSQLGSADGYGCRSVWMSATLDEKWLETVDFKAVLSDLPEDAHLRFNYQKEVASPNIDPEAKKAIKDRWTASKPLQKAGAAMDDAAALAREVVEAHKSGTRTIVVVNTVNRARKLHEQIGSQWGSGEDQRLVLLHSRFRPPDRKRCIEAALADPPSGGAIIVSTQVIEAGVDVSATTLFTELAPWPSLVQRSGRCNRRGEQNETASVRWIDLPAKKADAEKARFPYELADLRVAAELLKELADVGLGSLATHRKNLSDEQQAALFPHEHTHVIRKRDLLDLFDTTPDLAGNDIDIDRYVREVEDSDVRVFWREWETVNGESPPDDKRWRRVGRDELCPAPIGEFRAFALKRKASIWRWDHLEGKWIRPDAIYPGQVYLVRAETKKNGRVTTPGYDPQHGWGNSHEAEAENLGPYEAESPDDDAYDDDGLSMTDNFESIADHTEKVCKELLNVLSVLMVPEERVLQIAARWHDWGKAHASFQIKIEDGQELAARDENGNPRFRRKRDSKWQHWAGRRDVAKAPGKRWNQQGQLVDSGFWARDGKAKDGFRRHFRHELASALAVLQRPHAELSEQALTDDDLNLVAYLIAAHHGKVRLSIRSLPNETRPPAANGQSRRFVRGVWDGDELPGADLGQDKDGQRITAPAVTLSLEPMELGLCEQPPFACQPSWVERMIRLRDAPEMGPFRLAYLEALLRAADWRASAGAKTSSTTTQPGPQPHATEVGHG